MDGGYSDKVENGILYRIIECDDVMMFADRTLYLCVSDTAFYDTNAYNYDDSTGAISRNETYDGMNLLFTLPIDPSKADEAAAEAYLKALEESQNADSEEDAGEISALNDTAEEQSSEILELLRQGNKEEATKDAELLNTETLTLKDDHYEYSYATADEGIESAGVYYFYPDNFINGLDAAVDYNFDDEGEVKSLTIMIVQDNGDNTATLEVWKKAVS